MRISANSLRLLSLLLLMVFGIELQSGTAQFDRAIKASRLLPDHLDGFEVDRPLIIADENRDQDFISVSRIFYKTEGNEQVKLTFKDYSINPGDYKTQLENLKKLNARKDEESVSRFNGYIMNSERRENFIEKVLYLEQNLAIEVVHEGALSDTTLSTTLLKRVDTSALKSTLK